MIYDVKGAEAKQEKKREERIQFIKDMIAVTIYVILGFFVLYVLYRGWKYYNGSTPAFVSRSEQENVGMVEMSNPRFKNSKSAHFRQFSNEATANM